MANLVYDDEKQKKREAEVADLERAYAAPSAPEPDYGAVPSKELEKKEEAGAKPADDTIGEGFKNGPNKRSSRLSSALRINRSRRFILGGGLIGGLVALAITLFLSLLPLKILHIVENLQDKFFAPGQSAVQKESEVLLSKYLKLNVQKCKGSVVKKSCSPSYLSGATSPVSNLFRVWHENKLENTLADKYGIEIQYNSKSNQYLLKAPGLAHDEDVSRFIYKDGDLFAQVNKPQIRQAIDDAFQNESRWKGIYLRIKFGHFVETKYGVKRCLSEVACKVSDTINDTLKKPRRAAQVFLAERVLMPRSQIMGTVVLCLTGKIDCEPSHAKTTSCNPSRACDLNGAPETQGEKQVRTVLDRLIARYATDNAFQIYQDISDKGLGDYVVKQIASNLVDKAGGSAAAQQAATESVDKALPIIGWVNLGSQVVQGIKRAGPAIRTMRYVVNAGVMVSTYMMYRTWADQNKSGLTDPTENASMGDSLGSGPHTDNLDSQGNDPNIVGGTAPAEGSPIYDSVINGSGGSATALFDNFLGSKAYAANSAQATTNTGYLCNNKKPPPANTLCPEEVLNGGIPAADAASSIFAAGGSLASVGTLSDIWNGTIGKGLNLVGNTITTVVGLIPGFGNGLEYLNSLVSKVAKPFISWISDHFVPTLAGADTSGARTFDLMAGGADVAGNDFAHHDLGGRMLSDQEVADIVNEQTNQARNEFAHQSFFARMFDKSSRFSLISRLAMAMPLNKSSLGATSFGSLISSPLGKIFSSFSSIFSNGRAYAAAATPDPFRVTKYGYTDKDIPSDPEAFWNAHCTDSSFTDKWNKAAVHNINPSNGQLENTSTNPCLLIKTAIGSDGGYFDTSTLSSDDLNGTVSTPTAPTSGSGIVGDIGQSSDSVSCADGTKDLGVVTSRYTSTLKHQSGPLQIRLCQLSSIGGFGDDTTGNQIGGGAVVNSRVSGAFEALGERAASDGVQLASNSSFRLADSCNGTGDGSNCARPGSSNHQLGVAIDFQGVGHIFGSSTSSCSGRARDPSSPVWNWLYKNADAFGIKQYAYEAWHWDPIIDPSRCGYGQ